MDQKDYIITQIRKVRRNGFISSLIYLLFILLFLVLSPFVIIEKIQLREFSTVIILTLGEIILTIVAFLFFQIVKEKYSIKNSRILKCIENPDLVSEIIVQPSKIIFEIKGMEDETINLKNSDYRSKLIAAIESIFGKSKLIIES